MRMIDHEEMFDQGAPQFVKMLREKPYVYGGYFSPHDGGAREWGSGGFSPNEILASHGIVTMPVPRTSIEDRLHAGRMFISQCEFDERNCKEGIRSLRNYKWDIHSKTKERRRIPKHDWASHSADAFTYFALCASQMHTFVPTDNLFNDLEHDFA